VCESVYLVYIFGLLLALGEVENTFALCGAGCKVGSGQVVVKFSVVWWSGRMLI